MKRILSCLAVLAGAVMTLATGSAHADDMTRAGERVLAQRTRSAVRLEVLKARTARPAPRPAGETVAP